jgi:hypothetical protein
MTMVRPMTTSTRTRTKSPTVDDVVAGGGSACGIW